MGGDAKGIGVGQRSKALIKALCKGHRHDKV